MNILGINAFGQNPSACLVMDGVLKGFSHEERFNRLKCSHDLFPLNTIKWLLTSNDLCLDEIDYIAFNWDCNKYPKSMLFHMVGQRINISLSGYKNHISNINGSGAKSLDHLKEFSPQKIEQRIIDELSSLKRQKLPRIEFCDHHLCHAYQTFYHSGFKESIVLIADGHGEENTISGYAVKNEQFKKIINYKIPFSLGWFYAGMTSYLGFNPNRDEGKLMGLAAYGSKKDNPWIEIFDKLVNVNGGRLKINPYFFKMGSHNSSPYFSDNLEALITSKNKSLKAIKYPHAQKYLRKGYVDLAFAAQYKLEQALVHIVNELKSKTGMNRLCVAGGLGLNCKSNMELKRQCNLDEIFIHPASSDDGSAIGAAFMVAASANELKEKPLTNVYYGASFNNGQIRGILNNCQLNFSEHDNICETVANKLAEGKILAWFQNGAEMGARALGARSIIANPKDPCLKDKINSQVKYREQWRPYCPSILSEKAEEYIDDPKNTDYMILAAAAKDKLIKEAPAIVHMDNTVRPQNVKKERTPQWYQLIKEFDDLTGTPVLLNTSFNVRGEPIVNTPYDAIKTFYSTGLDALAIGNFIIEKS